MTFASAGWADRILRWHDPAARALYLARKERERDGEESLRVMAKWGQYFESLHALECYSLTPPRFFRNVPGVLPARWRTTVKTENKGVREFLNMAGFPTDAGWSDETLVVKLTGRYLLRRPDFLERCAATSACAVVKRDDDVWGERGKGVHTFLFAARAGLLRAFGRWLMAGEGPARFGRNPIEWAFYEFLQTTGEPVDYYPGRLHVLARYAPPLQPMEL